MNLNACKTFVGDVFSNIESAFSKKTENLKKINYIELVRSFFEKSINRIKKLRKYNFKEEIKNWPRSKIVMCVLAVLVIINWCILSGYCSTHFLKNTTLNGVDVSGMSVKQARSAIADSMKSYELTLIESNGMTEKITGEEIGLTVRVSENFDDILSRKSGYSWMSALLKKKELKDNHSIEYYYDDKLFNKKISSLACMNPVTIEEPQNAELVFSDGTFSVKPEICGSEISRKRLEESISKAISSNESYLDLVTEKIYKMPPVTSDNAELIAKKNSANDYAGMNIRLLIGSSEEIIDPETVLSWMKIERLSTGEYAVRLDDDGISNFVGYLADTYNTYKSPKIFYTHYGDAVELENSYYGWLLDNEYAFERLKDLINNRANVTIDLTDRSEDSDKWWTKKAVSYDPESYYGNTYAEVSIDGQYMWMVQDGVVILESDVVTGNPTNGHDTPKGAYTLIYKEKNATLKGEDYSTEVEDWMVFTDDIGFHDATWQDSFGGDWFYDNGSHGCVNLPLEVADELYEYVYPGMPVFVY